MIFCRRVDIGTNRTESVARLRARPPGYVDVKQVGFEGSAMKLRLLVEFDPETKRWSAVFPELSGCASAGDTEEEAVRNAKEALELWLELSEIKPAEGAKMLEVSLP